MTTADNGNPPLFITGAPRSGTSWVGELLGSARHIRYVYEPFNPQWNPVLTGEIEHFEYLSGQSQAPEIIQRVADRAFSGRQTSRQILRSVYRGYLWPSIRPFGQVVVKDPTAVLLADWISARYDARVLIVMRHPCAFASSIIGLGWYLSNYRFMVQSQLMADFLSPYVEIMKKTEADPWTRAAATWGIIHVVLLAQTKRHPNWVWCRYEDLCDDYQSRLPSLYENLGIEFRQSRRSIENRSRRKASRDPGSTRKVTQDMPQIWKSRLSAGQIDAVLGVVGQFGLSHLYP